MLNYYLIWLSLVTVIVASVYPNYHGVFEFTSWDTKKTLKDYENEYKWWQTATFYQIYPRSFKDSNGDGVGDLKGITEKLSYLKELGITATWLSPIFTSPMADFGYDIANFTQIDPLFGTMQDFDDLIIKAKELGIKILLDFVPNHSSDQCEWFQKSAAKDPQYKDFYVWHPGKMINGQRQPPTNWLSVFRGSAWTWHEGRQEYYLHQFLSKQPDFNYRNPQVKETLHEVLRFWLNKGVAGFRVDSVAHIYEVAADASNNWPDEPRNPSNNDPNDYNYLRHIYTVDQPETMDVLYGWRKVLDDYQKENGGDDRVLLAETYSPLSEVMKYYGNATMNGAHIPFNFLLIEMLSNYSSAQDYFNVVKAWLNVMPEGRTANWVIGNHDQRRVASRFGTDRVDMWNMLLSVLPGCSITYMGEEIGMTDVWISWHDTVDPSACNSNPDIYEKFSRDPERTPFQWSDDFQAGFSTANKTWLPISDNYHQINVKLEQNQPQSHLNIYKALQELRKEATMRFGLMDMKVINNNVLAVQRYLLNDITYILLMNINDKVETINLTNTLNNLPKDLMYEMVTEQSSHKKGDRILAAEVQLNAKEVIILSSMTKLTTTAGYFTYYTSAKEPQNKSEEVNI